MYVRQDDTNEETKQTQENGKLQKVKRNRAALDVKSRFEFRYKKAFVKIGREAKISYRALCQF